MFAYMIFLAFFVGDKRFYIRGIAYQPGGADSGLDAFAGTHQSLLIRAR